jgi:quinoprotein glucose dehydrogenase
MIWGVWEVGFDFWALTPRSDILVFFGIWLILPFVWRRLIVPSSGAVAALVVALLISGGILTWAGFNDPQEINGTLRNPRLRRRSLRLPTATGLPMAVTRKVSATLR